ncbi:MAG: D-alanyl-D-alanine carboxypeptidase [Candidatus Brennerbacteria bacterium]|nr:D-alanyl-D-alanine carboxypeptidase [Candidatus Brennerbacteria bacterium]
MKTSYYSLLFTVVVLASVFVNKSILSRSETPAAVLEQSRPASFNQAVAVSSFLGKETVNQRTVLADLNSAAAPIKKSGAQPPWIEAAAALAVDLDNGFKFFGFNSDKRWPIASLTKLMTALIAEEKIGLKKNIIVSQKAIATEGGAGGLESGGSYLAKDLIKAMMAVSSNDAAAALAEFYGDENLIEEMNGKAEALGMNQTRFFNPSGLSVLNQSTANDLQKLAGFILANKPEIFAISREPKNSIYEINSKKRIDLVNINKFSGQPDFIGGKTGFLEEAQQNLLSIFRFNNRNILIIILGSKKDRFEETLKIFNWIKQTYY